MSYYVASKQSVVNWIKGLAQENQVYFPLRHGEVSYRFAQVGPDSDLQFEPYVPTVVPPVSFSHRPEISFCSSKRMRMANAK